MLNTGRTVEHWHTRTKTKEVPILERLSGDLRILRPVGDDRFEIYGRKGKLYFDRYNSWAVEIRSPARTSSRLTFADSAFHHSLSTA